MKISTDSVLIGAWADAKNGKRILDIGTGTGIIALMLAQRSKAIIDAIDIDKESCCQARDNFEKSKWAERLNIYCSALQDFFPSKKYDIIVSNPPFFPCPATHKEKKGSEARYSHKLPFEDLADGVDRLLSPRGKFFAILPVHEGAFFTNEAEKRGLYLCEYIWVKTTFRKRFPKRILLRFEKVRRKIKEDEILVIQDDNGYTDEFKKLTSSFYLSF